MLDLSGEMGDTMSMKTRTDLIAGDYVRGIFPQKDGTFLALTFTKCKYFKTYRGAVKWMDRHVNV